MQFEKTIAFLEKKLREPLPGLVSHKKFMFANRLQLSLNVPSDVRQSAVLILLYPSDGKAFFPLILRPPYDGRHGGQMALPGGKVEQVDETLVRTALREAQEEIGVKALDVNVIGELTEVYIPISNFIVKPVVGFVDYKPEFFPDAREVEKVFFTDLGDITKKENIQSKKMKLGNVYLQVPGFEIQNEWVWGATSLILGEFADILSSDKAYL